ncbi:MAG: cytochrome c3 family protein [bacterium]
MMKFGNIAFLVLILIQSGCREEETGLIYSHDEHAQEIADQRGYRVCTACHTLSEDAAHFTVPSHTDVTGCNGFGSCHKSAVEVAKSVPSEDCLECHTRRDGKIKRISLRFTDVNFSHEKHKKNSAGTEYKCTDCHQQIDGNPKYHKLTKTINSRPMQMETCIACHTEVGASTQCQVCHDVMRPGIKPAYHTANWTSTHGKAIKRYGATICQRCHDPLSLSGGDSCEECHTTTKPASHTLRWAKSTHGRVANRDRQFCATCHQADFCSNCHSQKPATHFAALFVDDGSGHAALARSKLRSCYSCHSFETDCSQCHSK